MKQNNALYYITLILTVLGAVNWGLVGLADMNLVKTLFGTMPTVERLVYILVGASGLIYGILAVNDHQCHVNHHSSNRQS
jgi:uncharacterized protein